MILHRLLPVLLLLLLSTASWSDDGLPGRRSDTNTANTTNTTNTTTGIMGSTGAGRTRTNTSIAQGDKFVLRFQVSPTVNSQVVRLDDLIEVVSWGTRANEDLLQIPLGPAPQAGGFQDWTSTDLIRNLELRGIDPKKVSWQGPESVRLIRRRDTDPQTKPAVAASKKLTPAFLTDRLAAQAEANIAQATREYLWIESGQRTPWRISFQLPIELASSLSNKRNILSVGGGKAPWIDRQRLVYLIKHEGEECELEMTVQVDLPKTVVVAKRPIRRDEVIDESCLEYAAIPERLEEQADQYCDDMSQLIGLQMRRAVSTGVPILKTAIGQPNVISSGEIIEVESVAGSVVVKAAAKALSAGAVGDMINIELVPSRKRLVATVAGPMLVRITGKKVTQESLDENTPASEPPPTANRQLPTAIAARSALPPKTAQSSNKRDLNNRGELR